MFSPLPFGVIGSGDVLLRFLDAIHTHSGEVVLSALADVLTPEAARRRLQELDLVGVPYFQVQGDECQLPEEFWDLCDAVYIAVPNRYHKPYTLAALEHGKHVLIEKPIARTAEEAYEIIEAAARSPARIYCTLHYAHFGISLILLWLIQSGQLQEFGLGLCVQVQGALLEADRRCDWRFDPAMSGGDILIDTGGHLLSVLYALGAQAKVTNAAWDTVFNSWREVEIGGQRRRPATYFELGFALEGELFAPSARGHIVVGKFIPKELAQKFLRFEFENGEVFLSFPDRLAVLANGRPPLVLEEGKPGWPKQIWRMPYRNIVQQFLEHVRKGADIKRNLEIAFATLQDVFEAYRLCQRIDFYNRAEALLAVR